MASPIDLQSGNGSSSWGFNNPLVDFFQKIGDWLSGASSAKSQGEQNLGLQHDAQKYNSAEAERQRAWEEHMASTQYQRAVEDLKKAGLNPWLAVSGINGGSPSGASASSSANSVSQRPSGAQTISSLANTAVSAAIIAKIVAKIIA